MRDRLSGDWDIETDVLVVGAGACGLAAAIAASANGVQATVVERSERLGVGSNTAISSGSVIGANTRFQREAGIQDSPQLLLDDLVRQSGPSDEPELAQVLAEGSASLVEWLVDAVQVNLRLITDYRHVGHSVSRLHAPPSRRGEHLLEDLERSAAEHEITVALASPVEQLVTDAGAVVGGVIDGGRAGRTRVRAKKVILATSGFAANREYVRTYCPEIAGAPYFGAGGSMGDAIRWGKEVGAVLGNMGSYQGFASVSHPHGSNLSWTTVEMGGILVNRRGDRFGDESVGYSGFAGRVLAQAELVFALFDARIRDYVASHEEKFRELADSASVKEMNSLEELAAIWNIDAARLIATLDRYERAASCGIPDQFGRRDFGMAPLRPPYVMGQVQAGLFHTQGGLRIDGRARVRSGRGGVIPNLFAGGGAAVGISGRRDGAGYSSGAGLLCALGLGRIAGTTAALEINGHA